VKLTLDAREEACLPSMEARQKNRRFGGRERGQRKAARAVACGRHALRGLAVQLPLGIPKQKVMHQRGFRWVFVPGHVSSDNRCSPRRGRCWFSSKAAANCAVPAGATPPYKLAAAARASQFVNSYPSQRSIRPGPAGAHAKRVQTLVPEDFLAVRPRISFPVVRMPGMQRESFTASSLFVASLVRRSRYPSQ